MPFRLLTVEDNPQIREMIDDYFTSRDEVIFELDFAADGNTGLEKVYENEYDLVLLDITQSIASGLK